MSDHFLLRGVALIALACGIYLLQASARLRGENPLRLIGGWGLVLGSVIVWGFTSAADKGVALGIVAFVLVVLAFLMRTALVADQRVGKVMPERAADADKISLVTMLKRVWAGILMGPISGASAVAICTAGFVGLDAVGVEHTINLTIVSLMFPFVWAVLAVLGGYEPRTLHKSISILGAGIVPSIYLFLAS